MDKRSWLWRRKSSEKSPSGETDSSAGSVSSHSERCSDDQVGIFIFFILKKIINLHLCPLKLILPITANFVVVAVLGMFYFWKTCAFLNSSNHNQIKIL